MYIQFYGLQVRPFDLTPDPELLYWSPSHKRALAYLEYGLRKQMGFIAITEEVGAGKTTLIRYLLDRISHERTTIGRVFHTHVNREQFLEMIARDFEIADGRTTRPELLDVLYQFLIDEHTRGRHVLLVVDEAQNMDVETLEEIRMLFNLETDKKKLLQILLVGQPRLRDRLSSPDLEQLRQRVAVSFHLSALDAQDTAGYIPIPVNE